MTTRSIGFHAEVEVLNEIAAVLGKYRHAGDQMNFQQTLEALGMVPEEAQAYWSALSPDNNGSEAFNLAGVRNNTELANAFGILLDSNSRFPRNWLLYRLLECHFPDILKVQLLGQRHMGGRASKGDPPERRRIVFEKGLVKPNGSVRGDRGASMPVYQVYQGRQPAHFSALALQAAAPLCAALGEEWGMQWAELFVSCKMLIPPAAVAKLFARIIAAGQKGEPVTLVGAFCPDYAYEETGNPQLPYRYTFNGVGEGVGLVAQQFVRIVPAISGFLTQLRINHRIVLGIGDFEADSPAVLERVGLQQAEFKRRCQCSLEAFRAAVSPDLPLTLELCGEERSNGRFRQYCHEATRRMYLGDFGQMRALYEDLAEVIARIPNQYRTFYERWYGHRMSDQEVSSLVYSQGGEYAALAKIYADDFGPNVVMLAGDRPEMHRFNTFFQTLPTLCAKRAY
ncbi:MAG: hypothetical protein WD200_02040 [Candidatus Andersenbacteria bacterium]